MCACVWVFFLPSVDKRAFSLMWGAGEANFKGSRSSWLGECLLIHDH